MIYPNSRCGQLKEDERTVSRLADLNTRRRPTCVAAVRNLNPERSAEMPQRNRPLADRMEPVARSGTPIVLAPGHARESAVAGREVAGRRVEQYNVQTARRGPFDDVARLEVVGERELDRAEARVRGLGEAFEERDFVEEERQVRCETGHLEWPSDRKSRHAAACAARSDPGIVRMESRSNPV